jgi:hyperosmotically inducible periplasmic protein
MQSKMEVDMNSRKGAPRKTMVGMSLLFLSPCMFPLKGTAQASTQVLTRAGSHPVEQVRKELILLPYYGIFDHLAFEIKDNDTVVLTGQVTRPTLRSDAERVVRKIEAAGKVENQIEVLPNSPNDDRIRIATYRAIYSKPGLDRYALRAVPPIHIIVKHGEVTLMGVVATETDKNLAGLMANGVPGVFRVTNHLRIEKEPS